MRWLAGAFFVLGVGLQAQQTMPVGILHGSLVSLEGGSLSVREANGAVLDCFYDDHTLFQRNSWPVHADDLNAGEPVVVLSDHKPGTHVCYTRMLSVVYTLPTPRRRPRPPRETWTPRGYLTYSGLVVKQEDSRITIKTRDGSRTLLLRADTRYSDATEPLVNKHVFIRAARNIQGALEAYQIAWGEILSVP
jgi:hypothetical protein